ncbi:MAG: UDP-N-acetylglucosamine 2-epimerase, partial [Victivallales bacterium]|nr:UDP-N-acetylglucosamine 2-epimerase [Victivallales bacterium]
MKKKRILILSGSTGGGHVSAALSLENCAAKSFSSELEVIHIDIIEHMSKVFKKIYADSYNNIIINSPKLYGYLYSMTDHNKDDKSKFILTKMRYYFEEFFALKLKKIIKKLAPDVIICTHFLPAEHLNNAAKDGKFANKYCVVITDYDVHWLWAQKNMDMFFVATEEEAERLIDKGINSEKIHITGIPIKPDFAVEYDKKETRRKLGLHEDKKTLLIMTGAYGAGRIQEFMEYFMRNVKEDFQAVLITGKNKELFRSLRKYHKEYPNKIKLIRFTKEVHKYMAASDFILSKTGGLTTSECIAMGLPVITVNPIPGQEDRNTNYLL